jgi:hypothetical protein
VLQRPSVLGANWVGETVFVIGGGPSVLQQNLPLLRGRRVIAINSSYERLPGFGPPPHLPHIDLLVFGDSRWWRKHAPAMARLKCPIVTPCDYIKDHRVVRVAKRRPPGLSNSPLALTMRKTTFTAGINAAALKAPGGKIILLGADGRFAQDGRRNHHTPHPWKHLDGAWDRHRAELATTVGPLKALGIDVFNASPGSAWADLWPVMTLEEAIERADQRIEERGRGNQLHGRCDVHAAGL